MSDEAHPPTSLEEALAAIPPEQRAQLEEQARTEAMFANPLPVPAQWHFQAVKLGDGQPGVILSIRQPNSTQRTVLTRDDARAFASQLRKIAETGPSLVPALPGLIVPRA